MYTISGDGNLVLTFTALDIPEQRILKNIEQGHKSEIYLSYRIQQNTGAMFLMAGEHQEVNIRRTGFRDKITGDYVLMMNGRETAIHSNSADFFRDFSSSIVYTSRNAIKNNPNIQVKVRVRVIYKKLVPPFSMMYLIPGKFMHSYPWKTASVEEAP